MSVFVSKVRTKEQIEDLIVRAPRRGSGDRQCDSSGEVGWTHTISCSRPLGHSGVHVRYATQEFQLTGQAGEYPFAYWVRSD